MNIGQFTSAEDALYAIFAGNARITLVSRRTGSRFTYRVAQPKDKRNGGPSLFFANLLSGPNNGSDFTYLGVAGPSGVRATAKSRISPEAPSFRALDWALRMLAQGTLPEELEIWHEGRCCRCGRALTVPGSIATGLGPECERKMME